jgi:hypothetical protein
MKLNAETIFGGVSAVAAIVALWYLNKNQGTTVNNIPALQAPTQQSPNVPIIALAAPTSEPFQTPTQPLSPQANAPAYLSYQRGPRHAPWKARHIEQQAENQAASTCPCKGGCGETCDPCKGAKPIVQTTPLQQLTQLATIAPTMVSGVAQNYTMESNISAFNNQIFGEQFVNNTTNVGRTIVPVVPTATPGMSTPIQFSNN